MLGFKHFKSVSSTIQGVEAMNMIRKGQARAKSVIEEIALVNVIFGEHKKYSYKAISLFFFKLEDFLQHNRFSSLDSKKYSSWERLKNKLERDKEAKIMEVNKNEKNN